MSRWRWHIKRVFERIWVRVSAFGVLGVLTALGAAAIGRLVPEDLGFSVSANAIESLLEIIASSMLTVSTFSLSIMVSAFSAAQGSATPRAITLLQSDRLTQHVLASFIGAFVYALVGIITLETGIYGDSGRLVLFAVTIAVVAVIVIMLLRWIQHLSEFGRLEDTASRVEEATRQALMRRAEDPVLGCADWQEPPVGSWPVMAEGAGHVQHVDPDYLQQIAQMMDCRIWILAQPGTFAHPGTVLLRCDALLEDAQARRAAEDKMRAGFSIGHARSYEQDPEFGLRAMSEIASRALSPAVNDPGTAIDILGRLMVVLVDWARHRPAPQEVRCLRVMARELDPEGLIRNAFDAIGRDGAAQIEVATRLQDVLAGLCMTDRRFVVPARAMAQRAAALSEQQMALPEDAASIRARAAALGNVT
ncbi:DUF2254 domain-containing protein [Thioclava sp. GXIMD4216]|uniref:DUF2254 domain-containing protein n=1 Tax=Thioclava litoralis TaxID=3076557 RepID=A0ABZ1E7B5_9RHOB|nr:DUF2254 domain-containing protein [Thioclava sp. FTW29]